MARTIFPVAVIAVSLLLAKQAKESNNLVVNGNMEQVVDGKPAKWVAGCSDGGKVEIHSSTEQPKEGKYCLRMKGDAEWAVAFSERIPADRTKTYVLTGYARAKSGTAYIKIDYYQRDKYLDAYTSSEEVTSDSWTKLTVTTDLGNHAGATHILAVAVSVGKFETWFDDFVVTAK